MSCFGGSIRSPERRQAPRRSRLGDEEGNLRDVTQILGEIGLAFGFVAWWNHSRSRLEIVNLIDVAPAEKRSKRTRVVDAVVLPQMAFQRGNDLNR